MYSLEIRQASCTFRAKYYYYIVWHVIFVRFWYDDEPIKYKFSINIARHYIRTKDNAEAHSALIIDKAVSSSKLNE